MPPDRAHRRAAPHARRSVAQGYRDALAAAGITVPDSYIVHASDDASGYRGPPPARAEPRPDAIFGYNDPTAAGAMKAILEAGIAIPEEIKVIGVGNVHYSDLLRVPLSTIDQSSTLSASRPPIC